MDGKILKKLRLQYDLTQEQLGEKVGVAASTIRMIELGKRNGSKEVVGKLADFFNVSLDFLDGRDTQTASEDRGQMIDDFLDVLIDEGIIENPNDIDDKTTEMILNAVKSQLAYKMIKKNK